MPTITITTECGETTCEPCDFQPMLEGEAECCLFNKMREWKEMRMVYMRLPECIARFGGGGQKPHEVVEETHG